MFSSESRVTRKCKRLLSFQVGWFAEFPWLHYCSEVCGVLCFYCAKAETSRLSNLAKRHETAFIVDGFANWKKAIEKFRDHQNRQSHRFSVQQLVQTSKPVDIQLSPNILTSQEQSRQCLSMIFTSLRLLARQGQALHGHDDKDGNCC